MNAPNPKTLFEKVWTSHVVTQEPGSPAVLSIDLHLVHEVTSPQAFAGLRARGIPVRKPGRTFATVDHSIPTGDPAVPLSDPLASRQIGQMEENARWGGIRFFGMNSAQRGIVHVIGPELGLTQPGMTVVCGDSHTSTHGAFGALAFGIGTSEVEHVLATQCLLQRRPGVCEVRIEGTPGPGVTAKDIVLALLARGHLLVEDVPGVGKTTLARTLAAAATQSFSLGARAGATMAFTVSTSASNTISAATTTESRRRRSKS